MLNKIPFTQSASFQTIDQKAPIFSRNKEPEQMVAISQIPDDAGLNFQSYGFGTPGEMVVFCVRDASGQPIIAAKKLSPTAKNPSYLLACIRFKNREAAGVPSWFNLNSLVVEDANREGHGEGYQRMKTDFMNHRERVEFLMSGDRPKILTCTQISKKPFTKFVDGQPTSETEERNYAEYIIE